MIVFLELSFRHLPIQVTFTIHSSKIQVKFMIHLGDIKLTLGIHSSDIQVTIKIHSDIEELPENFLDMQDTIRGHSSDIHETFE